MTTPTADESCVAAIKKNRTEEVATLLKSAQVNLDEIRIKFTTIESSSSGYVTCHELPLRYVVKRGSLEMFKMLMMHAKPEAEEINVLFVLALEYNKAALIPEFLSDSRVNINCLITSKYVGITPLLFAYKSKNSTIFRALLASSRIDVNETMSYRCLIAGEVKYVVLMVIYDEKFSVSQRVRDNYLAPLLEHYVALMINHPDRMRDAFKEHPKLTTVLAYFRKDLWRFLNAQASIEKREEFLSLYQRIINSEMLDPSMHDPFYTVFSQRRTLFNQALSFWSNGSGFDELEVIKQRVTPVVLSNETTVCNGLS